MIERIIGTVSWLATFAFIAATMPRRFAKRRAVRGFNLEEPHSNAGAFLVRTYRA